MTPLPTFVGMILDRRHAVAAQLQILGIKSTGPATVP